MKGNKIVPTIVIEWDKADELFWTLRLTEFFGDVKKGWGYQSNTEWIKNSPNHMSYIDSQVSEDEDVSGKCSCDIFLDDNELHFDVYLRNNSLRTLEDCWGWLCLIHRWAKAFQANCELPVGPPDRPWVSASSLPVPLERWLKWSPVAGRQDVAARIGQNQGTRWQPHIQARQGAVRAWRVEGDQQQFVQLVSPDAIILGWSHWPCTDMGVYFGTLESGQTGHITGRLEFFENAFVPI